MSRLLKLKKWMTLSEAARHLSTVFEESVNEVDILQLAIERQLVISINFVNEVVAKRGEIVPLSKRGALPGILSPELKLYDFLDVGEGLTSLQGVWDLPMIGAEIGEIQNRFHFLAGGPKVTSVYLSGVFVQGKNGEFFQIQEGCWDSSVAEKEEEESSRYLAESFCPAKSLPQEGMLVVRTDALAALVAKVSENEREAKVVTAYAHAKGGSHAHAHPYLTMTGDSGGNAGSERSLSARERTTYLNIIGALRSLIMGESRSGKKYAMFESQAEIISVLLNNYGGYSGISKISLELKFAEANRSLKAQQHLK